MKLLFEPGALLKITLQGPLFFNPNDISREAMVLNKEQFNRLFHHPRQSVFQDEDTKETTLRESGWMEIPSIIIGTYGGYRPGMLKLVPFYGLRHRFAEYFIIPEADIKRIQSRRKW